MIAAAFWVSLMVAVPLGGTPQGNHQEPDRSATPSAAPAQSTPKSDKIVPPSLGTTPQENPATRIRKNEPHLGQFERAEHFHLQNINAKMIERCLAVARDIDPKLADRLSLLRKKDPKRFAQQMNRVGKRLISLANLRERDYELYRLKLFEMQTEADARQVARDCRLARESGQTDKANELEARLYKLLSALTAISLKTREDYLCRLQDHVLKLEKDLARDRAHMEELTKDRLQHMLHGNRKPSPAKTLRPQKSESGAHPAATQPAPEGGLDDRNP